MLYSREFVSKQVKMEGSFSNARAMAQLREYYMRMVCDDHPLSYNWERKRHTFEEYVKTEANHFKLQIQSDLPVA